ncbi:MAG: hypothetical protein K6A80_01545 [Saccharofermentans sp.]|nr:hypothetical protein [Saccharofermentans sp.]
MAEGDFKISELSDGNLTPDSVFVTADEVSGSYVIQNHKASEIASKLFNSFAYTQDLDTTDKKPVGAINEVADTLGVMLEGTLEAGQTSMTIQNSHITVNSMVDIHTDISPISVTTSTGQLILTFEEQEEDLTVKVVVF